MAEFGRCSSRYHAGTCFETFRGEAATGSAEAAEAWPSTLLANQRSASALEPAREQAAQIELASQDEPHDLATLGEMRGSWAYTGR